MKYILQFKVFSEEKAARYIEVVRDSKYWNEVFDPNFATVFAAQKDALTFAREITNCAEYISAVSKDKALQDFEDWKRDGMVYGRRMIVDKSISRKYNNETPDEVLDWWIKYKNNNDSAIRYEDYKTWPKLYDVFECLWEAKKYEIGAMSFEMRVGKETKFETFKDQLDKIIDHVTHLNEEDGKVIDIFDRFLSEGGNTVYLVVNKNGTYSVNGRFNEIVKEKSLRECFDYLQKERYYK